MGSVIRFSLPAKGPFSMESARTLQCGCMRASRTCSVEGAVRLAFPLDGTFEIVGAKIEQKGGELWVEAIGTEDQATLSAQLARILAVDHDGEQFASIFRNEPALARLDQVGFRPIVFFSPYVSAGWHILSHRTRMAHAAVVQSRLAEAAGDVVEIDGARLPSFPRPETFLKMNGFAGISTEKWERLRGIAVAALEGKLDRKRLLSMRREEAMRDLMELRGVGKFIAEAILIRGCGPADMLPTDLTMMKSGVQKVYGLDAPPSDVEVIRIAEGWKPFRTWMTVFMVKESFREPRARYSPRANFKSASAR